MPAERSRGSMKREHSDVGAQLTWTLPLEPASTQSIAFAPNLTPITFNDSPLAVEATFEPVLFPTPTGECSSRRPTHSKKRPDDHIPRPPNAFILFRSSFIKSQHVSTGVETNHSTLSKIIGLTWQNMPHDERQIWHAKAKKALEDHRRKWPQYAFRPSHTKAKGGTEKRKVREVEPKDMKRCAKIAELLVEGKKGQELEDAIQEFDRTHVPEVVTRFEAPITARAYRRSSSAPIDNLETNKPFLSSSPAPRRVRATSSQPSLSSTWKSQCDDLTPRSDGLASDACFDVSASSSFISSDYSFPAKPQPSMEFDPFMFDVAFGNSIASAGPTFPDFSPSPCETRVQTPSLVIDTAQGSDWSQASSPYCASPVTPHFPLDRSFDTLCAEGGNPFMSSSFSFNNSYPLPCNEGFSDSFNTFSPPENLDGSSFPQEDFFSKTQFSLFEPGKLELASVDMEFSAFMSSLSAF
ncbi:hypothetical protein DEU56DRAFT_729083 [Suillus clintonianus]|uniref:uncharacterized protein n=1 Tax=Suillus clintonianus TaxID=1904413 RepID=UPI001B880D3E|nr:uncharacterized protein DEU56DRAFT_729083 [Suillus clintonianus]KAG2150361.1 hypothetical protein DEU56DRAFT_729083 [Suillus clintonianus]